MPGAVQVVTLPVVVIRPIELLPRLVNHSAPMRAATKISNPLLYADMPVIAITACSEQSNCRVLIGTMPGNSVCGGSHGRGTRRCGAGQGGGDL